jgi:cob(I)alamin adenosyltransferase
MGHRLSKIYTRTGDTGTTGLGDGQRVDKDCPRVEAFGTVDELNSHIGAVLSHSLPEAIESCLTASSRPSTPSVWKNGWMPLILNCRR